MYLNDNIGVDFMFSKERKYDNPQFEIVVINSVDVITASDNELEAGELFGNKF